MKNSKQKRNIMVISDLHFSDDNYGSQNKSLLQEKEYENKLLTFLAQKKDEMGIGYLIVGGDIADTGISEEFEAGRTFLNQLCDVLTIDKNNVLIIPGNHDFDWAEYKSFLKSHAIQKDMFVDYQDNKFREFLDFCDKFYPTKRIKTLQCAVPIIMHVPEIAAVIIGINSVYIDSFSEADHMGYVEVHALDKELKKIREQYENHCIIAVMHHSPAQTEDGKRQISNWSEVESVFNKYDVHSYIAGHEHTSDGMTITTRYSNDFLVCGSLGAKDSEVRNSFLVLKYQMEGTQYRLCPSVFQYEADYNPRGGYWQEQTEKNNMMRYILLSEKTGTGAVEERINEEYVEESPFCEVNISDVGLDDVTDYERFRIVNEGRCYVEDIIKKEQLYLLGHFHWTNKAATLSYINTNVLFENYENIEKVKICFESMFRHYKIQPDVVVGYEMHGSMLGLLLAVEHGGVFTYCPGINRAHSKYEHELPDVEKCECAVIVVDFIYKEYLALQLEEMLRKKYSGLKNIYVCALIYGKNPNDEVNGNHLIIHEDGRVLITICFVDAVTILKCGFLPEKCDIYRRRLATVHKMYADDK